MFDNLIEDEGLAIFEECSDVSAIYTATHSLQTLKEISEVEENNRLESIYLLEGFPEPELILELAQEMMMDVCSIVEWFTHRSMS
jgi:hypothetical protein